ncbi:T6SS effector BTH_I2691 family protein [Stenotrophomonas rhizophila]|uniref:T6SS effector BTH_I2691 family protein n=1 Tax=Stenotrophomonas rhizophila TaxID=216778 RepID=UPI0028A79E10|nr:T6SS effector BTH_I2691 family protein [Stenotrophomonas rhizophila]
MPDFKPGWYQVGAADADGNTTLLHFESEQMVTAECYLTADRRKIWVSGNRRPVPWREGYTYVPNDPKGHWDNKAVAGKKKGGAGADNKPGAQRTSGGKTPCEDASLVCEICDQKGLPIMPLRYAVARNDFETKAPSLREPFGADVTSIALPDEHAKYTLRVLRQGYLYVFNEKRGQWRGYVVSQGGFLLEYDLEAGPPPDVGTAKPCARMSKSASSRCVMIPDAEKAGNIWMGFSDTAWTAAVLENNKREAYRTKHMQCVDVGAWVTGTRNQKHSAALDKLVTHVSEFAMPLPPLDFLKPDFLPPLLQNFTYQIRLLGGTPAFSHSLQAFENASASAHDFIEAAAKAVASLPNKTPALMLAVNDPVGVTAEIASLMSARMQRFLAQPAIQWPLVTASTIDSLQGIVKNQTIMSRISRTKDTGNMVMAGPNPSMGLARIFGGEEYRKNADAAAELLTTTNKATVEKAADEKWNSYLEKLRGGKGAPEYKAKQRSLQQSIKKFDESVIVPLAEAHKAWMTGSALAGCMECNHDEADPHSGQGYVESLTLCIQDTQDKKLCFDVYDGWLNAKEIDRNNLLLRAIFYNQTDVIRRIGTAVGKGFDPSMLKTLPWDALIGAYANAVKEIGEGGQNAAVRLMTSVGGPLMGMVDKVFDRGVGPALLAMGVVAGTPVVSVKWQGTKAEAIKELILRMQAVNPGIGDVDKFALQNAIDIEMRRSNIYGTPLGRGDFDYLIFTDKSVIEDFPSNTGSAHNPAKKLAEMSILTEEEVRQKTQLRWKQLSGSNIRIGLLTGIMQTIALGKLADDVDSSMVHEREENRWRMRAGLTALIGTTSELIENWGKNASLAGSRFARFMPANVGRIIGIGGRTFGLAAGALMAFWDGHRAIREYEEGNKGVAVLYWMSAVVGLGAMFAFSSWGGAILGASATGVGIVLVVIAIFIAIIIEFNKDDKLQDWLERSYFGKFAESERYGSFDKQMEELQVALKD